jgi:hypothetical protein
VGKKDIDGAPRGNQPPFVLPVRQGSHPDPGKKNVVVKLFLGYAKLDT